MRLSQTKFAGIVGCTQQNISKLVKRGVIIPEDDYKIDLDKGLDALRAEGLLDSNDKLKGILVDDKENEDLEVNLLDLNESNKSNSNNFDPYASSSRNVEDDGSNENDEDFENSIGMPTHASLKSTTEFYKGQLAKLAYEEKRGTLIPMNDAKAYVTEHLSPVSQRIDDLPFNTRIKFPDMTDELFEYLLNEMNEMKMIIQDKF